MRYLSHGLEKVEKKSTWLASKTQSLKGGVDSAGFHGQPGGSLACSVGPLHVEVQRPGFLASLCTNLGHEVQSNQVLVFCSIAGLRPRCGRAP